MWLYLWYLEEVADEGISNTSGAYVLTQLLVHHLPGPVDVTGTELAGTGRTAALFLLFLVPGADLVWLATYVPLDLV